MSDIKSNEQCIIGMPSCGYGFDSARMCFIARPADPEFQLEEDILTQILSERNYDTYVALQQIDPGNLAFCTKICSKIITSRFCIVLLNPSKHAQHPDIKISNPNVHLEYGMMLSFHKHVIPMQRSAEDLPFNIYPIDTVKYEPDTFKTKAEEAIVDAILRFETKEPPGRPIGSADDALKYFAFSGLRYTPITSDDARVVYSLGQAQGFNLFDGKDELVFFGYFHELEPTEIGVRIRILLQNIEIGRARIASAEASPQKDAASKLFTKIRVEVLVPEDCDRDGLEAALSEFQPSVPVPTKFLTAAEIKQIVQAEYERMRV